MTLTAFVAFSVAATATGCSSSSSSNDADAGPATSTSATQWCTGDGAGISGGLPYHCFAKYVTCDSKTTLSVDCPAPGDGGATPCKCTTNGANGPTFDRGNTCDEIAKGNYAVGNSRFQAACGWGAYDLSNRVGTK